MDQPTFSAPNAGELDWIREQLRAVRPLVDAFSPADTGAELRGEVLDRAFAGWLKQAGGSDPNAGINAIGVAMGQLLVDHLGFSWVIAADPSGSELAVLALPGRGDVLIYPQSFVAKRWERRETGFIGPFLKQVREQLGQLRSSQDEPKRPWWRVW